MIWRNSLKRLPTIDTITMRIEQRTKKVQSQKSIFFSSTFQHCIEDDRQKKNILHTNALFPF